MFERFTPRARRVIVLAQDAAREMGHPEIKPEHLVLGLAQGDGLAANAMSEAGVDLPALRQRVGALYKTKPSAKKINKVPFSTAAKKCLEQSLRAALALGHNYIGTEHLFFGVQRQAESADQPLDDVLGVSASDIHRRLTDLLSSLGSAGPMRSPALRAALERARSQAGESPATTGHVLAGMLADLNSQVARALTGMGIDAQQVQTALDAVDLAETSDHDPTPQRITLTIGDNTTVIDDPQIATALKQLNTEQLRDVIKRAIEPPASGQAAG